MNSTRCILSAFIWCYLDIKAKIVVFLELDEPTASLDPVAMEKIEDLINKLREDYTIVIVTHSSAQAARVSDYVAFLYLGELVEVGKTEKIFKKPESELTKRYLMGRVG